MIFTTTYGKLISDEAGMTGDGHPVYRILGIPYATAQRFHAPEAISYQRKEIINSGRGYCFPQRMIPGFFNLFLKHFQLRPEWQPRGDVQSEDSLRVNAWTCELDTPKPVLVFIHGGDCGSGTTPVYDGTHLAKQGIVVVTVTYRIGLLGHLRVVDGDRISCDRALLDQQAALTWVRSHIAELGGDPGNITLMGHCGGAFYALYQALNPDNHDLFHRLILCSGQRATPAPLDPEKEYIDFQEFLSRNHLASYNDLLDLSPKNILRLKAPRTFLSTTLEPPFFTDNPLDALREGRFPHIPVLIGTTGDELSMIEIPMWYKRMGIATNEADFSSTTERLYGHYAKLMADALRPESQNVTDLQIKMMELLMFHGASLNLMDQFSRFTNVYGYRFDYIPNLYRGLRGSYHGAEVVIFFNTLDRMRIPVSDENRAAVATVQQDWLAFIRDGIIPGRPRFGPDTKITHYQGNGEEIPFPHAELLRELEETDLATRALDNFMQQR